MSEKFDPTEHYIRITVQDKIDLMGELWSIYEALVEGLAESSVHNLKGRSMIAAATQRIGKLLGLDKIANAVYVEKDEPRSDVVISEEHADTFIKMVDEPVFNKDMAKLMREATEVFPEEVSMFPVVAEEEDV